MPVDKGTIQDQLAAELKRLRRRQQQAQREMDDCVLRAREAGVPWPIIAKAIDRSPRYLTHKYGKTAAQQATEAREKRALQEKTS